MSTQFKPFQRQNPSKVAVVTGGNKGLGYALVRKLLKKFRGDVYLTARNEEKGLAACEQLKKEGLHPPKFYQLDIQNREDIMEFRHHLEKTYGGIDLLINNASVPYKTSSHEDHHKEEGHHDGEGDDATNNHNAENEGAPVVQAEANVAAEAQQLVVNLTLNEEKNEDKDLKAMSPAERYKLCRKDRHPPEGIWVPKVEVDPNVELAEMTMKTNVVGTVNVIHCLLPLFRMHGRIINISSSLGVLSTVNDPAKKAKFEDSYLLESDLVEFLKTYITDVKDGVAEEKGWPSNAWILSKLAINLLTRILARDHKYDARKDILIAACCPDLSEDLTPLTADQGAESALYLALLPKGSKDLHGKIFKDKKIMEWV